MKVLIVVADAQMVDAITVAMQFHWHDVQVFTAMDGERGLEGFYEHNPDVALVGASMPSKNGFEVLQAIRRVSDVPVLMLAGRSCETDEVRGLDLGADDYILNPLAPLTLLARIKAVLRRAKQQAPERMLPDFTAGNLTIDFEAQAVRLSGKRVALTAAEYKLLFHLARNADRVLTHQALMECIWGSELGASANNLKALVSRLRSKLEPKTSDHNYIQNQRGLGYRFVRPNGLPGNPSATRASGVDARSA